MKTRTIGMQDIPDCLRNIETPKELNDFLDKTREDIIAKNEAKKRTRQMLDTKELRKRAENPRRVFDAMLVLEILDALEETQRMLAERSETVLEQNKMIARQLDALEAADALATTALKAYKELEAGYETCGLIVDMKHQATKYRAARGGK